MPETAFIETNGPPARRKSAAILFLTAVSALLSLIVLTRSDILFTSDTLTLAEFVWDLIHMDGAWANFQQGHSPCLFPDILIQWPIHALTGSWRAASAALAAFIVTWLFSLAVWITTRIARCGMMTATLACGLLIVPILLIAVVTGPVTIGEPGIDVVFLPWLLVFLPGGYHGGPFLTAMTIACIGGPDAPLRPWLRHTAMAVLCFGAGTSDLLCVGWVLVPMTMALLLRVRIKGERVARTAILLAIAWAAFALGYRVQISFDQQGMLHYPLIMVLRHIGLFVINFGHHPDLLLTFVVFLAALAHQAGRDGPRAMLANYWLVVAAVSGFGSLALTVCVYVDVWTFRYAEPFLWWPVLLSASWLATLLTRDPGRWRHLPVVVTSAMAVACAALNAWPPRLLVWRPSPADCLLEAGFQAGLGDFWHARQTSAISDWRLQVEPLNDGAALLWGNDRRWFARDIHAPSRPPPYRFIIMDGLAPEQIRTNFGPPARTTTCAGSEVWIYGGDGAVYRALRRVSPDLMEPWVPAGMNSGG